MNELVPGGTCGPGIGSGVVDKLRRPVSTDQEATQEASQIRPHPCAAWGLTSIGGVCCGAHFMHAAGDDSWP
jgi:hypothetical protein